MTDLPLPEPDGWIFQNSETWMMCEVTNDGVNNAENFAANNPRHELVDSFYLSRHLREAAAKTAALQAKVTRYEESTRLAEAHITLTLAQLTEAQAECARLRAAYLQQSKEFGYELRDPNGTIWDECRRLQAALDAALRGKEAP